MATFKLTFTVLAALVLSACTAIQPASDQEGAFILPDIPDEPLPSRGIPYPKLDQQTQIDQLGIQVARLEREMDMMQTRVGQLERVNKIRPAKNTAPAQRLNDAKLKAAYLNNGGSAVTNADAVTLNETRLYNQALKFYQRGNYVAAAAVLRGADGGNGSEAARRNMYLLLQTQQRLNNCESVIQIGGRYANRFRGSAQAPDALFSIGQCQYNMQQKDIARSTWRKLIQTYPDSDAAKRAAVRIKQR
ncbi:tetratricopeptide repeat protein [Neisseria sp. CCUG12390]|uniref:tetratricopeptide repeat protein n=1 Tax=Neisseria sp. CCUG12390 TaxID=3392035 RepID=UPI003A103202